MRDIKLSFISWTLWSFGFVLIGLESYAQDDKAPQIQEGILDLSEVNWTDNFVYNLDGEWEFYWNQLIHPHDFKENSKPKTYLKVPTSWTTQTNAQGEKYPAIGEATYRLKVILPPDIQEIDIAIPQIWTAGRVWMNQKAITHESEKISDSLQQAIIKITSTVAISQPELIITAQAKNESFFIAGLVKGFQIGAKGELQKQHQLINVRQIMWLGVLYVMSLYHLVLYFFRKKNISTLYFGLICFVIGLRFTIFGDHFIYEYLHLHSTFFSSNIQVKIYYLGNAALIPLALSYAQSLYPQEATLRITGLVNRILHLINLRSFAQQNQGYIEKASLIHVATLILGGYVITGILMPFLIFNETIIPMQVFVFGFAGYLVIILFRAAIRKRPESSLQMIGILTMIFAGINDALHTIEIKLVDESEFLPLAFGIFLSLQFLIIARRFSRAFTEVEDLSANLEQKVIERTAEVSQQKEELEIQGEQLLEQNAKLTKTNKHITDSVRYARRIQRAVLGSEDFISEQFREGFVLLLPKDIVSGDFYFHAYKENKQIIMAADCTGHGVPGAFMTIMGYNFLDEIITQDGITDPAQILYELDQKITSSLHKDGRQSANDGMDAAILVIDKSKQEVQFSGAKNPLYQVDALGELHQYKGSRATVGGTTRLRKKKIFETINISYQSKDNFYIFSDGFQDQFGGEEGQKYLTKNFRHFIHTISSLPMEKQRRKLRRELHRWQGYRPQTDDILIIGFRL